MSKVTNIVLSVLIVGCTSVVRQAVHGRSRDCNDIGCYFDQRTMANGVYTVYVGRQQTPLQVYCDMTTDGGGWTVCIHRRSQDFVCGVLCPQKKLTTFIGCHPQKTV